MVCPCYSIRFIEPFLATSVYTTSSLGEFAQVADKWKAELVSLGIEVNLRYPSTTIRSLLELLEYTVEKGKQLRLADGTRDQEYTVSHTEYQQTIVAALTPDTEDCLDEQGNAIY